MIRLDIYFYFKFSIVLTLAWKDVLTNEFYPSNNIYHEYYNVLFNLAVMYYLMVKILFNLRENPRIMETKQR